jgi:DNA-binding MarR family transcriptional regulator
MAADPDPIVEALGSHAAKASRPIMEVAGSGSGVVPASARSIGPDEQFEEDQVRRIIELRVRRTALFGKGLFKQPAWDILLELYADDLGHKRLSVTQLCAASHISMATAVRWLRALEDRGWVVRTTDLADHRRSLTSLSTEGRRMMDVYFGDPMFVPVRKARLTG